MAKNKTKVQSPLWKPFTTDVPSRTYGADGERRSGRNAAKSSASASGLGSQRAFSPATPSPTNSEEEAESLTETQSNKRSNRVREKSQKAKEIDADRELDEALPASKRQTTADLPVRSAGRADDRDGLQHETPEIKDEIACRELMGLSSQSQSTWIPQPSGEARTFDNEPELLQQYQPPTVTPVPRSRSRSRHERYDSKTEIPPLVPRRQG